MYATPKPTVKPARTHFSSGPCAKRPGWSLDALKGALVGRSHRSPSPITRGNFRRVRAWGPM